MQANLSKLLWYEAYKNMFEMMDLRNYVSQNNFIEDVDEFNEFRAGNNILKFTKENDPLTNYVFFIPKIDTGELNSIKSTMENEKAKLNKNLNLGAGNNNNNNGGPIIAKSIQCYIITSEVVKGKVEKELMILAPPLTSRINRDKSVAMMYIRVLFLDDLQYNPLKHNLQPKIRLITSEVEKEELRLKLIRASYDKNQTLYELLPLIYTTDPITIWYDAQVGDVFYFVRTIGGITPYYRIVVPAIDSPDDKLNPKNK